MTLTGKIILLELALPFSTATEAKTQYFINLSFNSTLQLINDILSDSQKLLKNFNGTGIVVFFRIELFPCVTVFPNNLVLYLEDLKSLVLTIIASTICCVTIIQIIFCPVVH